MTPAAVAARRSARASASARPARRPSRRRTATARSGSAHQRHAVRGSRTHSGAQLIPVAAARTAGAVGEIADSGLMVRLTRGRLWIALLAALLAGIVAMNVVSLSFSSEASRLAERSEALEQRNSVLRAQLAKRLSSKRVESTAASLGLAVPEPGEIVYLSPDERDAQVAARRLAAGELSGAPDLAQTEPAAEATAVP